MKAVLYICHGSRVKAGQKAALDFIEKTKPLVTYPIQEACFLELAEPTIEQGVRSCVEKGATEILAVPFLLLQAGHSKVDIPEALARAVKSYPHITVKYGKPLGVQEEIIDVLIERMNEVATPTPETRILLVGRGSSDPNIQEDFQQICAIFKQKTALQHVDVCFLAACEPLFPTALQTILHNKPQQLIILPYLLFTGILLASMEKAISKCETTTSIYLADSLGHALQVRQALKNRVEEAEFKEELFSCFRLCLK